MITTLVLEEAQISVLRYMTSTTTKSVSITPVLKEFQISVFCGMTEFLWELTGNKTTSTPPRRASLVLK